MGGSCWGEQSVSPSLWPWGREAGSLCCPVRPLEVTGAAPQLKENLTDMLTRCPLPPPTCPCGQVRFPMGAFEDGRWGSRGLVCWEARCFQSLMWA